MADKKKTPKDAGKEYLDSLLKHVPEAQREAVRAAIEGSEAALHTLGEGVLSRSESDRLYADLQREKAETAALHESNKRWYGENVQALTHYAELRSSGALERLNKVTDDNDRDRRRRDDDDDDDDDRGGKRGGKNTPQIDTAKLITTENIAQHVRALVQPAADALALTSYTLPVIIANHAKEFGGEVLDVAEFNKFIRDNRYQDPVKGYEAFVYQRRVEAVNERHKNELKEAEKRGEEKAIAALRATGVVYPVGGTKPEDIGPLDAALAAAAEKTTPFGAEAAARHYLERTAPGRTT